MLLNHPIIKVKFRFKLFDTLQHYNEDIKIIIKVAKKYEQKLI